MHVLSEGYEIVGLLWLGSLGSGVVVIVDVGRY